MADLQNAQLNDMDLEDVVANPDMSLEVDMDIDTNINADTDAGVEARINSGEDPNVGGVIVIDPDADMIVEVWINSGDDIASKNDGNIIPEISSDDDNDIGLEADMDVDDSSQDEDIDPENNSDAIPEIDVDMSSNEDENIPEADAEFGPDAEAGAANPNGADNINEGAIAIFNPIVAVINPHGNLINNPAHNLYGVFPREHRFQNGGIPNRRVIINQEPEQEIEPRIPFFQFPENMEEHLFYIFVNLSVIFVLTGFLIFALITRRIPTANPIGDIQHDSNPDAAVGINSATPVIVVSGSNPIASVVSEAVNNLICHDNRLEDLGFDLRPRTNNFRTERDVDQEGEGDPALVQFHGEDFPFIFVNLLTLFLFSLIFVIASFR